MFCHISCKEKERYKNDDMQKHVKINSFVSLQNSQKSIVQFLPEDVLQIITEQYIIENFRVEEIIKNKFNEVYKNYIKFRDEHVYFFLLHDNLELLIEVFQQEKRVNKNYKLSLIHKKHIVNTIFLHNKMHLLDTCQTLFELDPKSSFVDAMFCAVQGNHFDLVKWIYENKTFTGWEKNSLAKEAIKVGNLEMLKFLYENNLHLENKFETILSETEIAAEYGHVHILEWFLENSHLLSNAGKRLSHAYRRAATKGQVEVLKFLDAKYPNYETEANTWKSLTSRTLSEVNDLLVMKYLYEKKPDLFKDISWSAVANQGNLDILKWYDEIDGQNTIINEIMDPTSRTSAFLRRFGKIEVIEWLYQKQKFEVNQSDCVHAGFFGNIELVKWIFYNFQVTETSHLRFTLDNLLKFCRHTTSLEFIKSLNFHDRIFTLKTLKFACLGGDIEKIKWCHFHLKRHTMSNIVSKVVSNTSTTKEDNQSQEQQTDQDLENKEKSEQEQFYLKDGEIVFHDEKYSWLCEVAAKCPLEVVKWVHFHTYTKKSDEVDMCLSNAASNEDPEVIKWLYHNRKDLKFTQKAVENSINANNIDILEWLLDQEEFANYEFTPALYSCPNKYDIVQVLIKRKINFSQSAIDNCKDERILEMLQENSHLLVVV